jgi:hypothetical protein
VDHLREHGFRATLEDRTGAVRTRYRVPRALESCHTAVVDGYVIEGHVPAAAIDRLLAERPAVAGLAVPGMPVGSPGMEVPGRPPDRYQVVAFDATGRTSVFERR